jgi:hypothetical protein
LVLGLLKKIRGIQPFCPSFNLFRAASTMKKKRASEPELAPFRLQFLLDADLFPVGKYFMAPSADEAFKMFAFSCREFLPDSNINAEEENCFINAFSNPHEPCLDPPEMEAVPSPLPELDKEEEEDSKTVMEEVTVPRPDPLVEAGAGDAESPFAQVPLDTASRINGDPAPAENISQPSPAAEYARKRSERDAEIIRITAANADKQVEYDRKAGKAKGQVMDVKERLSLTGFAELNRWSNEWKELPQPGSEPETAEPQEASVTEVIE